MKRYKVYFYFGVHEINPFVTPKIVQVIVPDEKQFSEKDIVLEGLKKLSAYPRTYTARVEEVK